MTAPVLSAELKAVLKKLKLGHVIPTLADRLVLAETQGLSIEETLLLVLSDEVSRRDCTACQRRATRAGLDPEMQLERWDKQAKVRYDKRVLAELASLRFVETGRNAVVLGPVVVSSDPFRATPTKSFCSCRSTPSEPAMVASRDGIATVRGN